MLRGVTGEFRAGRWRQSCVSGVGKTTFLNVLCDRAPGAPRGGSSSTTAGEDTNTSGGAGGGSDPPRIPPPPPLPPPPVLLLLPVVVVLFGGRSVNNDLQAYTPRGTRAAGRHHAPVAHRRGEPMDLRLPSPAQAQAITPFSPLPSSSSSPWCCAGGSGGRSEEQKPAKAAAGQEGGQHHARARALETPQDLIGDERRRGISGGSASG